MIRAIDALDVRPIIGSEGGDNPQFSPDGRWIAFRVGSVLKKVPVAGGPPTAINDDIQSYSWGDDDVIVFTRLHGTGRGRAGLWRTTAEGASVTRLTVPDSAFPNHAAPFVLPGGAAVVFSERVSRMESDELAVARMSDGKAERLGLRGSNPRYIPTGHLLFGRGDGTVSAVPFDLSTLKTTGPAETVLQGVNVEQGASFGGATAIAVAPNGTLVYAPDNQEGHLIRVDRGGVARPISGEGRRYEQPRLSTDGKRLAVTIVSAQASPDVWLQDLAEGTLTRVTNNGRSDRPMWTPDGTRIAWHVAVGNPTHDMLMWRPWDGGAAAERLIDDAITFDLSRDGKFLATTALRDGAPDVDVVALDKTRRRTRAVSKTQIAFSPRISPDSRWLAFGSTETGRPEVYVQLITGDGGYHQISNEGGSEAVWSHDGHELFYRANGKIMSATIATTPSFSVVRRESLFDDVYQRGILFPDYDVARDGKTFIMVKPLNLSQPPVIVFGWLDELRERMKSAARR